MMFCAAVVAAPPVDQRISGTVRDFSASHPDFDVAPTAHVAGNVELTLSTGRPVYTGAGYQVATQWTNAAGQAIAPHMFGQDGGGGGGGGPCGPIDVLLVVQNAAVMTSQDASKKAVMESWGHSVSVIDDEATQAQIDAAVAVHDLVYISEEVDHGAVDNKYMFVPIGLVNEDKDLSDHELGFSNSKKTWTGSTIRIVNNTHEITLGFPLGDLTITSDTWNMHRADGAVAPGGINLAEKPNQAGRPALMVVERGELLKDGDPAPARRVRLPWGNHSVDFNTINAVGLQIMERAVCWAASNNPPACGSVNDGAGTAGAASAGAITSAASFDQWYRDLLGVNLSMNYPITLVNDGTGVYEYVTSGFHPIDGILFGNEGAEHNGNFTYTITAEFTYVQCAGQFVEFAGAGDAWLFVGDAAAMDLGGVVPATTQIVEMDRLGLLDGAVSQIRFFHARRQAASSGFSMRTNIEFIEQATVATATWPAD